MKRLIIPGAILVSVLIGIALGHRGAPTYVIKKEAQQDHVDVYNCVATPDYVIVPNGDSLQWAVVQHPGEPDDDALYLVSVQPIGSQPYPLANNAVPVFALNSPATATVSVQDCDKNNPTNCGRYRYVLYRVKGLGSTEACKDPGIHVKPSANVSLLFKIRSLLLSVFGFDI